MIDRDLAELYQVTTKVLNQAVKRNIERFPDGFMFRLTKKERDELVTNCDHLLNLEPEAGLSDPYEKYYSSRNYSSAHLPHSR